MINIKNLKESEILLITEVSQQWDMENPIAVTLQGAFGCLKVDYWTLIKVTSSKTFMATPPLFF